MTIAILKEIYMSSIELILAIKEYAKLQGIDFEIALKMLGMMHEDGVHKGKEH
jgi:hypothetical protein